MSLFDLLHHFGIPPKPTPPQIVHIPISFGASSVADAHKAFPKPVFQNWLRFRRKAATLLHPDWKEHPPHERVQILDECAAYLAMLN